jgi:16S rRNA (uracil1498-N3)-methyltransferase
MASLPLFFHHTGFTADSVLQLDEDTAKHVVQVLRMQSGEKLQLTDGKGSVADVTITDTAKKKCNVSIDTVTKHEPPAAKLHLAVAFTKNTARNEWLLEKATELGVSSIIPLSVTRSERERVRHDRWQNIIVSAMLQSQQYYLPKLSEATSLKDLFSQYNSSQQFIAHCIAEKKRKPIAEAIQSRKETLILIGPEGDFTEEEVTLCEGQGCVAISLASQRLRTETAAMMVCSYFNSINNETV